MTVVRTLCLGSSAVPAVATVAIFGEACPATASVHVDHAIPLGRGTITPAIDGNVRSSFDPITSADPAAHFLADRYVKTIGSVAVEVEAAGGAPSRAGSLPTARPVPPARPSWPTAIPLADQLGADRRPEELATLP